MITCGSNSPVCLLMVRQRCVCHGNTLVQSFFGSYLSAYSGQSSRTASTSPSIESLSGRAQSTSSPPPHSSRGSDVSASSPPPSANKKESFFNITRSRSHSKSMGKKETVSPSLFPFSDFPWTVLFSLSHTFTSAVTVHYSHCCSCCVPMFNLQEEDLEAQVSFLQGQINDLEAMSKYCARMMNTHICECTPSKPASLHHHLCLIMLSLVSKCLSWGTAAVYGRVNQKIWKFGDAFLLH